MAEAVGALRISLGLDSAQFQSGLRQASGSLETFAATATRIGAGIGVAMAGALAGVGNSVKNALDEADKLGKMAQSVGVPVEELSKLSLAAKLSDVSLEALGTSLGKLSKNMVAAAANPTGQAAQAFNALGISVRNADGSMKSSSVALGEIATKFSGYEDGVNKTALAMAYFGKTGAAMIPMLNGGADAIEDAKKEAEQFGIVVTKDMAAGAEAFNDNLTRLGVAASGLGMVVAGELAPSLKQISDGFIQWVKDADGVQIATDAMKGLLQGLVEVVVQTRGEFQALGAIFEYMKTFGNQILSDATASEFDAAFGALGDRLKGIRQDTQATLEAFKNAPPLTIKANVPKAQAPGLPDAGATKAKADEIDKSYQQIERAAQRVWENTRTPAEQLTNQLGKLQDMLAVGALDWDTYGRAVAAAHEKYDKSWVTLKDIGGTVESGLGNMFDGLIDGTGDAIKAIKDLGTSMLKMLANKAISSLIGGLFGTDKSAGGGGGFMSSIMGAFGLKGFASGGDFTGGKPILVGERGPEIITPRMAGSVIPNHELGGGGGSAPIINITAPPGSDVQTTQRQQGGQPVTDIVIGAAVNDLSRNGPFAQMLQSQYGLKRGSGR